MNTFITIFLSLYSVGITGVVVYCARLLDRHEIHKSSDPVPDATFDHRGLT